MTIRVVLADDHAVLREALRALIDSEPDLEVVGEAGTGQEAIAVARVQRPDVVLMDLVMPELDGLTATHILSEELPDVRVVILSGMSEDMSADRTTSAPWARSPDGARCRAACSSTCLAI